VKKQIFNDLATPLTRRRILGWGMAGVSALTLSTIPFGVVAREARHKADLELFMQVSRNLTMKETLSDTTGERIFRAMGGDKTEFVKALGRLNTPISSAADWSEQDKELARQVIQSWYLGHVGDGVDAKVIAYEDALMFDAVSGTLVPRSYCYRKPGYWSANPNKRA